MAGSQDSSPIRERCDTHLRKWRARTRSEAVISVFDAGFSLGDGVWESFRLQNGRLPFADRHLDRLFRGAATIRIDIGMTREQVAAALQQTIDANEMTDGVHIRLMVTRGMKRSPTQDPRLAVGTATVVIVRNGSNQELSLRRRVYVCSPPRCAAHDPTCSTCALIRTAVYTSSLRSYRQSRPVPTKL